MGAAIVVSMLLTKLIKTAAVAVIMIATAPAVAFDTNHDIGHRGASANEATYYEKLYDPAIPMKIREEISRILHEPTSLADRVLQSALNKVGSPDYEEEHGNSNLAPGITKVLQAVGVKAGSSWCAASITDDLRTAWPNHNPPIGSASVTNLLLQAYYAGSLHKGHRFIQPGDLASHTDSSHIFIFLAPDPNNPKFSWGIDGNAQDWKGTSPDTAHEGERLVYRPLNKIKEYISLSELSNRPSSP